MLINLPLYFARTEEMSNSGRVVFDALRCYLDHLIETEPDCAPKHSAVAELSLSLLDKILSHTEELEEYVEVDPKGDLQTVYRPFSYQPLTSDALTATDGAETQKTI